MANSRKTTKVSHFSPEQFSEGGLDCCLLPLAAVSEVQRMLVAILQSLGRVPLCHPCGLNPPGSSVHGISQARILE